MITSSNLVASRWMRETADKVFITRTDYMFNSALYLCAYIQQISISGHTSLSIPDSVSFCGLTSSPYANVDYVEAISIVVDKA